MMINHLFNLVYFIIFVTALANVINPRWFWKHSQGWKATEEPSNIYFLIQRIIALITLIVVAIMILLHNNSKFINKLLAPPFATMS